MSKTNETVAKATAKCYPPEDEYEQWKERADELDMTVSEFIQSMVWGGIRALDGFETRRGRTDTLDELYEQRRELREEKERLHRELKATRDRLADTEESDVLESIESAPSGLGFQEVIERVTEPQKVRKRVRNHLARLEEQGEIKMADAESVYVTADGDS